MGSGVGAGTPGASQIGEAIEGVGFGPRRGAVGTILPYFERSKEFEDAVIVKTRVRV